jgi:hypothetical protein
MRVVSDGLGSDQRRLRLVRDPLSGMIIMRGASLGFGLADET